MYEEPVKKVLNITVLAIAEEEIKPKETEMIVCVKLPHQPGFSFSAYLDTFAKTIILPLSSDFHPPHSLSFCKYITSYAKSISVFSI